MTKNNLIILFLNIFLVETCYSQTNYLSQSDSAYIYKSILFNFQSYLNFKYIQSESPKLNSGYVFTNYNPALLDTNELFPIDLYPLFVEGYSDTDCMFFSFNLSPQKLNYQTDLYTSIDSKYYCPLMRSGVVAYFKSSREIKFINGYFFLTDSYFLLKKLEDKYQPKSKAIEIYIKIRFFNHNPSHIIVKPKNIEFFSTTLDQRLKLKRYLHAGSINRKAFYKQKNTEGQDTNCYMF